MKAWLCQLSPLPLCLALEFCPGLLEPRNPSMPSASPHTPAVQTLTPTITVTPLKTQLRPPQWVLSASPSSTEAKPQEMTHALLPPALPSIIELPGRAPRKPEDAGDEERGTCPTDITYRKPLCGFLGLTRTQSQVRLETFCSRISCPSSRTRSLEV